MSTYINKTQIGAAVFAALVAILAIAGSPQAAAANNQNCPLDFSEPADVINYTFDGTLSFSTFQQQNGQAGITVTNNSDCDLPLVLAAYEMNTGNILEEQQLHAEDTVVVPANSSQTLTVDLPSCMAQIDLLHEPNQDGAPTNPTQANPNLIGFTFYENAEDIFAENDIFHFSSDSPYSELDNFPDDADDSFRNASPVAGSNYCDAPPELSASCSVSPDSPTVGETVTWSSNATGGTGNYSYGWSGDASGNAQTVEETYQTSGTKEASVTVTSGEQSVTKTCSVDVAATTDNCPYPNDILPIDEPADLFDYALDGTLSFSQFEQTNGSVGITVTNNSNCKLPLALGVYEMTGNQLSDQSRFSQDLAVVQPNGDQVTLSASLPSCMAQIDLLYDPDQNGAPDTPIQANPNLIGFTFFQNDQDIFAENDIFHFSSDSPYSELDNFPDDADDSFRNAGPSSNFCPANGGPDPLTGSCSVSPTSVEVGESVTWSATADGGSTPYTFSWSLEGKDGSFTSQNISTTYNNTGNFDGTITITDENGDSIQRTCSVQVTEDDDDGDGGGSGGGGGDLLDPRDDDDGDVRGDRDEDFAVQCEPARSSYLVGEIVSFTTRISGDIDEDDADISWDESGSNFEATNGEATTQYTTTGTKTFTVTAEYDDETETDVCRVRITAATAGVRLDQIPYTGSDNTAGTAGFIVGLTALAVAGGIFLLRRWDNDTIPVGIPNDNRS